MSYYKASIIYSGDLFSIYLDQFLDEVCPICHEDMLYRDTLVETNCHHVLHMSCFKLWSSNNINAILPCPLCRTGLEDVSRGVPRMSSLGSDSMNYVHPLVQRGQQLPGLMAARNSFYLSLTRTSGYSLGNFTQRVIMPLFLEKHEFYPFNHEAYMSLLNGEYKSNIGIIPVYRNRDNYFQFLIDLQFSLCRTMVVLKNWNYVDANPVIVHLLPGVVSELKNFWTGKRRTVTEYEMSVIKCKELTKVVDTNVNIELLTNNLAPYLAIYDHIDPFSLNNINPNELFRIKESCRLWGRIFRHLIMISIIYYCTYYISMHFTETPYLIIIGVIFQIWMSYYDFFIQ